VPDHHSKHKHPSTVQDEQCAETELFSQASCNHASVQGQASAAARKRTLLPWASEGSGTHRSIQKPTTAQSSQKRGSTVASDAEVSPQTEVQGQELINFTLTRLNNLRKQHRRKSAISQQTASAQRASLDTDSCQPRNPSTSVSSRATTSSRH
jgi:hypothetical protein